MGIGQQVPYIDMLGLNDRRIATRPVRQARLPWQRVPGHAKGDGAYVLSRHPDILILGPAEGTEAHRPMFLSDLEIAERADLARDYQLRRAYIDVTRDPEHSFHYATGSGVLRFTYYVRRGFTADSLPGTSDGATAPGAAPDPAGRR